MPPPIAEVVNTIMAPDNEIMAQRMRDRQMLVGKALYTRGIALKSVSQASGIPYNTIRSYFPYGQKTPVPAVMPISALVQLFGAVPDEILSILLEPEGRCFASVAEEDVEQLLETALAKVKAGKA